MESLMFLAVCGGIGFVVLWAVRNDGAGPEEATTGLLRMPPPPAGREGGAEPPAPGRRQAGGRDGRWRRPGKS